MTLTTPPMPEPPYARAEGPRSTSMREASAGSEATAWSGDRELASIWPRPFCSTSTRGPEKPRITGRLAPGPLALERRPGSEASTSPRPAGGAVSRASRFSTSTLVVAVSSETA